MSRQRKWQLEREAKGQCTQGGKPRRKGRKTCFKCGRKDSAYALAQYYKKKNETC